MNILTVAVAALNAPWPCAPTASIRRACGFDAIDDVDGASVVAGELDVVEVVQKEDRLRACGAGHFECRNDPVVSRGAGPAEAVDVCRRGVRRRFVDDVDEPVLG